MFLHVRLPSLTPNVYTFPSVYFFSSSFKTGSDQSAACNDRFAVFFPSSKSLIPFSAFLTCRQSCCGFRRSRCPLHSCRASTGNANPEPDVGSGDDSDQYLQALLLVPETVKHYNLWKEDFIEETKLRSPVQKYPFSSHRRGLDFSVHSIGLDFLRRFHSPTVFLKIACDGDLLLPIIVEEFTIIKLIDTTAGEEDKECPDQLQFVRNIVRTFGYEVNMVRITDRVVNTYYARIHLRKAANNTNITIDARPSDALNIAEKFKAPIYVNKEIVVKDAIKAVYGNWRARSTSVVYDASLDSVPEGQDLLVEELDLVQKMNKAIQEERYEEAALWRDKLTKIRYGL